MSELTSYRHDIGLYGAQFGEIFPFHIVMDRDLSVLQHGAKLHKFCPEIKTGVALPEVFEIITPSVDLTYDAIADQCFTVYFLRQIDKDLVLKGQMVLVDHDGEDLLIFLCNPTVRELDDVKALGLTLKDFAIHDQVVDFLVLLQTKTRTLQDLQEFSTRLRDEVKTRRAAQKELQDINKGLEARVAARTEELRREVDERKKAQEALNIKNIALRSMIEKLEAKNRQILILNKMGDMLQTCNTVEETYRVIADSLQKLFDLKGGFLASADDDGASFQVVKTWGEPSLSAQDILRADCWGLRRARIHQHDGAQEKTLCRHVGAVPFDGYVCVPLMVRGERLALLYLEWAPSALGDDGVDDVHSLAEERQQLVETVSEHLALAIANLRLQETLRYQSIRDPLTGLFNRRYMQETLESEVARAARHQSPLAIIMLDVDHFKSFNDTYGHAIGDQVLSELGAILLNGVRGEDTPCRYGGEEFILILPGADVEIAAKRAEQLRVRVERDLVVLQHDKKVPPTTISLGVAAFPVHGSSYQQVIEAADAALYRAKQQGRNCVVKAL